MEIHVVQKGDTLWQLSRRYGVSINDIAGANQLADLNLLIIGQSLVIPTPMQYHIVQPGESLWAIANRYGISLQELVDANRISSPSLIYPGQRLVIPRKRKPTIEANAYIEITGPAGAQIVNQVGEYLTYLSPFSYRAKADGTMVPFNDTELLQATRSNRDAPLMTITNFGEGGFNSELAHAILADTQIQNQLIGNLLNVMKSKGYFGLNIDFEYVLPGDRNLYNQFIERVAGRLHQEGYSVSSALAPKLSDEQKGLLYEAHDYAFHGRVLDFVVLMTYEWGWSGGPPMAVAPINQVRKVLDFAVTQIPRNKIMMGMPLYGYDWTLPYVAGGKWAPTISPQEALRRAMIHRVSIQYDPVAQSPFFYYVDAQGQNHVVWFEDARSVQVKFDTVKQYNLRGVSYWVLGNPFPQNWLLLADNFQIKKYVG
ncbi:LysM peptidoglycan-binding domain-containing protein [Ferviditalea candida]|uniref:LysM peptidoglycan-binding domain-containing protein n=1 Tax=Ferviditalea candida TaxID=3108399 RepID=A0ABU5ZJK8_9BACL|nr:LysM peptidoglycan-binding domain-containing protein [Paenibacillaceae bacterium T2]